MATHTDIYTMQSIARHYGGKCLSGAYKDEHSMLEWMCEKGHRWESAYKVVNQGGWCRQCLKKATTFNTINDIAINHGGKCLSTEYAGNLVKLEFECAEGHRWKTVPKSIKKGMWCNICSLKKAGFARRGALNTFITIAEANGGKCLSTEYVLSNLKLEFECDKGHKFFSTPSAIKGGYWCAICSKKRGALKRTDSIDLFRDIANKHGSKCLTDEYVSSRFKLKFQCANNHIFYLTPYNVKKENKCILFFPRIKVPQGSVKTFQKIALKRNGKCISTEYVNSITALKFECAKGHQWNATPNNIKQGSWCPTCMRISSDISKRDNIGTYQKIAEKHGGKCLSEHYITNNDKLEFECKNGHRWKADPGNIKNNGSWCRICRLKEGGLKQRIPLETYQNIALKLGGKCLSVSAGISTTKLEFQCKEGHRWFAQSSNVKNGAWCTICRNKQNGINSRDSLSIYQEIAKKHGGKCLSKTYFNKDGKLEFECAKGHVWKARAGDVKRKGTWCQRCRAAERKIKS